jgi:hypothetical protein
VAHGILNVSESQFEKQTHNILVANVTPEEILILKDAHICTLQVMGKDELLINIIEETEEDPKFSQKDVYYDANSNNEKHSVSLREMETTELIQQLNTVIPSLDVDFNGLNHAEIKSQSREFFS